MARLYVEEWSPEYGASVDTDESLAPSEGEVDVTVEQAPPWDPVDGVDDGFPAVAFVDGIRRVDARLTIDDPAAGPTPGICGSFAAGAAVWRREPLSTEVEVVRVRRLAIFTGGATAELPALGHGLSYEIESVAESDPGLLISHFHTQMRRTEAEVALELARSGYFVVADGPISELAAESVVGYIKSHRVSYLPQDVMPIMARLEPGQRTPLFGMPSYKRYSWYQRLSRPAGGHSWSGVVRCEAPQSVGLERAVVLANRTAALLPRFRSEPHIDPRAPQNLVPIGALERQLRARLGDRDLIYRALRAATMGVPA